MKIDDPKSMAEALVSFQKEMKAAFEAMIVAVTPAVEVFNRLGETINPTKRRGINAQRTPYGPSHRRRR